jgi:hypothetical protein
MPPSIWIRRRSGTRGRGLLDDLLQLERLGGIAHLRDHELRLGQLGGFERHQLARLGAERFDRLRHAAGALDRARHVLRLAVDVLGDEAIAEFADRPAHARVALRLDRDVALGVHAHRAVAQVGRADAQPFVVHRHHLRVDVEAGPFAQARHVGIEAVEMAVDVGGAQLAHELRA